MTTHKLSFLVTILLFQVIYFTSSQAQCSLKIDYKVESNSKGSSDVYIKSLEGSRTVKIQLYDLNSGQVVSENKIDIGSASEAIFTNVKSSLYLLYIWLPGCDKPVVFSGEQHGILIEN